MGNSLESDVRKAIEGTCFSVDSVYGENPRVILFGEYHSMPRTSSITYFTVEPPRRIIKLPQQHLDFVKILKRLKSHKPVLYIEGQPVEHASIRKHFPWFTWEVFDDVTPLYIESNELRDKYENAKNDQERDVANILREADMAKKMLGNPNDIKIGYFGADHVDPIADLLLREGVGSVVVKQSDRSFSKLYVDRSEFYLEWSEKNSKEVDEYLLYRIKIGEVISRNRGQKS